MNQGLGQLGRQLLTIWKQLGLNQRISVVLATAAAIGGLALLAIWSGRSEYALLYGKLDEAEAAKVIAALEEAKVPYKARGGGSIYVSSDKVHQMRMQLAGKGIPRGEGVGFEIFDKPNFGISDFIQRANFSRAVQGELARTIGQLDGIEAARVMIVLPENRLLVGNQKKPTASVFIRMKGGGQLGASGVNSIRFLVANSVEGLTASNVSVVDNLGNVLSENDEPDSLVGLSNNQLTARRNLEQYLTKKAEGMLDKVLGLGQAVVRVSADINWDTVTRYEEKFDPEGQVVRSATIRDENLETTTPGSGGVAGTASNTATETNAVASAASPGNTQKTKKKDTTNQYDINRTVSNLMQGAGGFKRLSAAIFVAQRFEGTGTARKALPRTPEELQKLKRIVQSALGIQETDPLRKDEIALEEIPFNEQPMIELTQKMETQENKRYWTDLGTKLLFPVLGLAILYGFWRAMGRSKSDDIPIEIPLPRAGMNGNGHFNGNGNGHRSVEPGVVTVDVLNQLIRENPANMTQAVRTWLTRGAKPAK
ncbi:MAG: flagellar M-ring protein FliF [Pedosphaera sp.]|nr:flagellar M-ring protein FliF [Pedosphaera sp.]